MAFPSNLEELEAAGYVFARSETCPACNEDVEIFTTPGKREISVNPMTAPFRPAIRHYETCGVPPISMYGVTDPNHQLLAVGWRDGVLVCQFAKGKGSYAGVPEAEFIKLRNVPFAYRILTTNIKNKYPYTKLS
jgi:hypothetical protein